MARRRKKRGLGMLVQKHGKIVDIPVRAGTVVRLREGRSGKVTSQKAMVLGNAPASAFSRAYGRQVYVCTVSNRFPGGANVSTTGAGDLYPVGQAKRVPVVCKEALADYKQSYEGLITTRKKRSGR